MGSPLPFLLFFCHLSSVLVLCLDYRIIHKFSNEAKGLGLGTWTQHPSPLKGSIDYYRLLHHHDLIKHGRQLLASGNSSDVVVLSQGNYTENLGPKFGGIHYTILDIGTPNVSFLVALDTGSDLLWIPCDCRQCSNIPELRKQLTTFNTKNSSSNTLLTCGSNYCWSNACRDRASICPYTVSYLSENTSTSGKLVQDVIHLFVPSTGSSTTASIVFGCGEEQTGLFLEGGAPNGLLGLGPGDISLPSLLAKDGVINDTFSMCFDSDGSGRLLFGDRGAKTQQTTPFYLNNGRKNAYDVVVEGFKVNNMNIATSFSALFDTGTTLTYLPGEAYAALTEAFDNRVTLRRLTQNVDPYKFCYLFDADEGDRYSPPTISMTFNEGGNFSVVDPFLVLQSSSGRNVGFCLAVIQSNIPIIGQNFMGGYRLSFDRELERLGWAPANCYHLEDSATFESSPRPPSFNRAPTQNRQDSPFFDAPVNSGSTRLVLHGLLATFLLFISVL